MDDWKYELVICEDCLRIIGDDPRGSGRKYHEVYRPCDSGPWCPDNDLPDQCEDKV